MPDRGLAVRILKSEFPDAEVGLDNFRPYAKLPDGRCFGILFKLEDGVATSPEFIIEFGKGHISSHNYRIHKALAE